MINKKTLLLLVIYFFFFVTTASAYVLCGFDWTNPNVSYYVNPNCTDPDVGTPEQQIAAMNAGDRAWPNEGNANFVFTYAGTTTVTDSVRDYTNEVMFFQDSGMGSSTIAVTWVWASGGVISECDMVFNDYNFTFSATGEPTNQEKDIWNVSAHEFGHFLCLDHSFYGTTMYWQIANGETYKRDLHSDDIAGIQYLYGAADNTNPVLSNGYVTPTQGSNRTTFHYYVDYSDADVNTPSVADVYIDGLPYAMTLDSGTPDNGTYRLDRVVGGGMGTVHNYYFYFEDGNGGDDLLPVLIPWDAYQGPTITIVVGPPIPAPRPNIIRP